MNYKDEFNIRVQFEIDQDNLGFRRRITFSERTCSRILWLGAFEKNLAVSLERSVKLAGLVAALFSKIDFLKSNLELIKLLWVAIIT